MTLTTEGFVRALYRGVLGREPDPDGFAHHVAALPEMDEAGAANAIRGFLDSTEFQHGRPLNDALTLLQVRPEGTPFAHVASLGTDCYASSTLKHMKLKRYSLPFDWIFSGLSMVAHCIEDGFATFLDPSQFHTVPAPLRRPDARVQKCEHSFYRREHGVHHVFNHYDPTELIWHAYLIRTVGRFRRLLASPERKLFVAIVKSSDAAQCHDDFVGLADVLDAHTHNAQLMTLAVLPALNTGQFGYAVVHQHRNHSLAALQPNSDLNGILFADPLDELLVRRVIAQHAFALADAI